MDVPTPGRREGRRYLPPTARAYGCTYLLHAGLKKIPTVGSQEGRYRTYRRQPGEKELPTVGSQEGSRFPITAKMLKVRKHVMDTKYSDQNNNICFQIM
jgi:hypothetical protein